MHLLRWAFSFGLVLSAAAGLAQGPDFALAQLEAGKEAFAQKRFGEAIDDFRVASFSLLDRPARLLESLARLSLAQSAAAFPAEERLATLNRFLELEAQFRLYAELDLEPATDRSFQTLLRRDISAERLAAFPEI